MKKITLFFLLTLLSLKTTSQNLESLLLAGDDANKLMENYISPVMDGMIFSLNNGWYHSAKTHNKLGFDITLNVNAAVTPNNVKTFIFNNSDYTNLSLRSGSQSTTMNTVLGSDNNQYIDIRIPDADDFKVTEFRLPDGIDEDLPLSAVPSPMLQLGLGLPFNTDIIVRYLPEINTDDINGNLFGAGLKHDLMQYFGPLEKLPLNVAVFTGFTKMSTTYNLEDNGMDGSNQEAVFELNTFTVQAIASLDFPLISIYGAVGYDKGSSNLAINGSYELEYTNDTGIQLPPVIITDPVDLDFEAASARATMGARLNLGFFKLFGDYTIKEYNTVSAGIAFSFR